MSINGDGMFTLALGQDNVTVDTCYFTRNGQFLTDKNGNIVNSSGLYLIGYQPNTNLDAVTDELGPMKEPPSPMQQGRQHKRSLPSILMLVRKL
jgi:flagellar hook protein FlgE